MPRIKDKNGKWRKNLDSEKSICKIQGCDRFVASNGMCPKCDLRTRRANMSPEEKQRYIARAKEREVAKKAGVKLEKLKTGVPAVAIEIRKLRACEKNKVWRENNKERRAAYRKEYNSRNTGKRHAYYEENKEWVSIYGKEYYKRNKEHHRQVMAEWGRNNPDKCRAIHHRRKARLLEVGGSFTGQEWVDLLEIYNNTCPCCGKRGVKLEVDHIVPISKGGSSNIDNIQPLCKSCNSTKSNRNCIRYEPWNFTRDVLGS